MSKQEEAGLILKLYELRREETLRKARDWFVREFNPQTVADFNAAATSANGAYVRMVISYWDMAAALVNDGAINLELFNTTNAEHFLVFSKLELLLDEIRTVYSPHFLKNIEKLIDATPDGRKRTADTRQRMKALRERLAQQQAGAQTKAIS